MRTRNFVLLTDISQLPDKKELTHLCGQNIILHFNGYILQGLIRHWNIKLTKHWSKTDLSLNYVWISTTHAHKIILIQKCFIGSYFALILLICIKRFRKTPCFIYYWVMLSSTQEAVSLNLRQRMVLFLMRSHLF